LQQPSSEERGGDRYRGTGVAPFMPTPDAKPVGRMPTYSATRCGRNDIEIEMSPVDVLATQPGVVDRLGRGFGGEAERRPVGPGTLVRRLAYADDGRLPAKAHSAPPARL
jgi:hypothetical protein